MNVNLSCVYKMSLAFILGLTFIGIISMEEYINNPTRTDFHLEETTENHLVVQPNGEDEMMPIGSFIMHENPDMPPTSFIVMFRTVNSERWIEEVVAFYVSQGAFLVHVADSSSHDRVRLILRPYINRGVVLYERFTFSKHTHGVELHAMAMRHIEKYNQDRTRDWWLISVDDDEYWLPKIHVFKHGTDVDRLNETKTPGHYRILEFLSLPEVRPYKSVRLSWRAVGTSDIEHQPNVTYGENRTAKLDVERYVRMHRPWGASRLKRGKPAFHINHPDVSVEMWVAENQNDTHPIPYFRRGGTYFLHGNSPAGLGNYSLLQHGFCYHYARAKDILYGRAGVWTDAKRKEGEAKKFKDLNDMVDLSLAMLSDEIKAVIDDYRDRK
mmetsp:Transcript_9349/g.14976  ORF Transcript_9349/g.14976 Transcript_9349/m.14976 type:complete len:383 (-) Transcript_9349:66-1214(-)